MPGFWQAQVALAWSYARPGRERESLEAVGLAKELSSTKSSGQDIHLVHYVEAVALQGLGRRAEAIVAAQPSASARQFLQQLTGESPS